MKTNGHRRHAKRGLLGCVGCVLWLAPKLRSAVEYANSRSTWEGLMDTERRWVPHYAVSTAAEIVEVQTDAHTRAQTSDLGLLGCYLDTLTPLPVGSKIRLRLSHQDRTFTALGSVVHSEPNIGMGIKFTAVELAQQAVLVKWLAGLSRPRA